MKPFRPSILRGAIALAILATAGAVRAGSTANRAYDAMGLKPQNVLTGSVLSSGVLPGDAKQLVAMVTYLTGKKDEATAVNVRLEVFHDSRGTLSSVYARDFGKEGGGYVARGELELVDLDGDGTNEIIVSWDDLSEPLIRVRTGEVIVHDRGAFRTAWSGAFEYDATRAARKLPEERRDRFTREVDVVETLRTRGATLILNKTVIAVAGDRLAEPKTVRETVPLRP